MLPSARLSWVVDSWADPELKRKTIGAEFIAVFEDEARKLGHIPWLAQGATLLGLPDEII